MSRKPKIKSDAKLAEAKRAHDKGHPFARYDALIIMSKSIPSSWRWAVDAVIEDGVKLARHGEARRRGRTKAEEKLSFEAFCYSNINEICEETGQSQTEAFETLSEETGFIGSETIRRAYFRASKKFTGRENFYYSETAHRAVMGIAPRPEEWSGVGLLLKKKSVR